MPAAESARWTSALPPRQGGVAQDAQLRREIREACSDALRSQQCFMAASQVEAARVQFAEKTAGARGRLLTAGHVAGARELVRAKINTSTYRDVDGAPWADGATWDHEEEDIGEDDVDAMERLSWSCTPGCTRAAAR